MQTPTKKANQLLAKDQAAREREELMLYIVNIPLPGEDFWSRPHDHPFGSNSQKPSERELEDIRKRLEQAESAPERRATLETQFKETWPDARPEQIWEMVEQEMNLSRNNPLLRHRALEEYWKRTSQQIVTPDLAGWTVEDYKNQTLRLREATEKHWPELWRPVKGQRSNVEDRAWGVIVAIRKYLRLFWQASEDKKTRARDWYLYRAREYCHRLRMLPQWIQEDLGKSMTIKVEEEVDKVPPLDGIESALYHLQERTKNEGSRPRICEGEECERPFFLPTATKSQTYCPDCRRSQSARDKASRLKSYHNNKSNWPSTANRRKKRG